MNLTIRHLDGTGAGPATDICGADVALRTPGALTDWNALVRAVLSHGSAAPVLLGRVLDAAPQFAMGHAARGLFSLLLGRAEMRGPAAAALAAARSAMAGTPGDARAGHWVTALDAWLCGRPGGAVAAMERCLARQPRDTLSLKVGHSIRFLLGDAAGMRASVERTLPAHGADHPLRGFALGMHAFALEETGDCAAAERAGLAALDHAPDDAWGLHAVTHVHDTRADPAAGIALIDGSGAAWQHCNNFRYHVWWHKALLLLDLGRADAALALYDAAVRADRTDDYRDIANATSLLMRLELDGVDVGTRWGELAALAAARTGDGSLVFADLHYMLALTGDGRGPDAAALLAAIDARGGCGGGAAHGARIAAHPGRAAAAGLLAFAEGRDDAAFDHLCAARPVMPSIGGSHAQRDVFERMTVDAGIRAGRLADAGAILADRTARRGGHADRFARMRAETIASRLRSVHAPAG